VIAYYLRHKEEVDAYLDEIEIASAELRRKFEAEYPPRVTKEILLARMAEMERKRAEAGQ